MKRHIYISISRVLANTVKLENNHEQNGDNPNNIMLDHGE